MPASSLVRARMRSPTIGCSDMIGPLLVGQRALLVQQLGRHRQLADVVQQRGVRDPLDVLVRQAEHHRDAAREPHDLLGVLVRVVVALLDRRGQRLDGRGGAAARLQQRKLTLNLRVSHGHAALAGALGEHQRAVGLLEQPVRVEAFVPGGDADRALAADRVAAALGDVGRGLLVGAGEQQHELVAAVAGDLVVRAQLALQRLGDPPQQLVAGGVPARVVDALEVVEVEDHRAERRLVAPRAGDLLADPDLHRAVVEDAGQRVGARDVLDVLVGLGVAAARRSPGRRSPPACAGRRRGRGGARSSRSRARRAARRPTPSAPRARSGSRSPPGPSGWATSRSVVVGDERLAGLEHAARGALAGLDAHAVPVLGDAVAGGRDRALAARCRGRRPTSRPPSASAASCTSVSRISCRSRLALSALAARTTARSWIEPAARRSSASRRASPAAAEAAASSAVPTSSGVISRGSVQPRMTTWRTLAAVG